MTLTVEDKWKWIGGCGEPLFWCSHFYFRPKGVIWSDPEFVVRIDTSFDDELANFLWSNFLWLEGMTFD